MKLTYDNIRAFVSLVECGSFIDAAKSLNITQPALTRRIQRLEEAAGAKLLDRHTKAVRLTIIGEKYLPIAQRTINNFEISTSELLDLVEARAGAVRVAINMTIASVVLPKILGAFSEGYPKVSVRVTDDSSPAIIKKVLSREAEFGIAAVTEPVEGIIFEPCYEDTFVMIAHPEHVLSVRKEITWKELEKHNFVKMRPESGTRRLVDQALSKKNILLKSQYEVAHLPALLGLIANNLGVSAVPFLAWSGRKDLALYSCPIVDPVISRTIGLITTSGTQLSPAAMALKETAKAVFAAKSFDIHNQIW